MHPVYGATGPTTQGQPGSRDLFRVQKDWDNAPKSYLESTALRALEIKRLIHQENQPKVMVKEEPVAAEASQPMEEESKKA